MAMDGLQSTPFGCSVEWIALLSTLYDTDFYMELKQYLGEIVRQQIRYNLQLRITRYILRSPLFSCCGKNHGANVAVIECNCLPPATAIPMTWMKLREDTTSYKFHEA